MKEFIDIANGETLGVSYTDEEAQVIVAAVTLYKTQLAAGRVTEIPAAVQAGIELCDTVLQTVTDELDIIPSNVEKVIAALFLPYTIRMHEGMSDDPELYEAVCAQLEITPTQLARSAFIAQAITACEPDTYPVIYPEG